VRPAAIGNDFKPDPPRIVERYKFMENAGRFYSNYVFEEDDAVLGFLSLVFYESVFLRVGTALVNELVVVESARGKGIGKALLETAIRDAKDRGMDGIEIGVEKKNAKAIAFSKANGINEEYLLLGREFGRNPTESTSGASRGQGEP
jgi:GNAT superfamily N-acetyltransferase